VYLKKEFFLSYFAFNKLNKIYNVSDPSFDPDEREEEMNRMREHVFGEIDKDKDRMVSLHEFLEATKEKEFEKNPEWKVRKSFSFFIRVIR
jgi:Ca2+-binding EF-hand superfamily protein